LVVSDVLDVYRLDPIRPSSTLSEDAERNGRSFDRTRKLATPDRRAVSGARYGGKTRATPLQDRTVGPSPAASPNGDASAGAEGAVTYETDELAQLPSAIRSHLGRAIRIVEREAVSVTKAAHRATTKTVREAVGPPPK
jgi:hypothetical protein